MPGVEFWEGYLSLSLPNNAVQVLSTDPLMNYISTLVTGEFRIIEVS
jgi:hypothetical protein